MNRIKIMLLLLPIGLIVGIALSLVVYFRTSEENDSEVAALMRREVSSEQLDRAIGTFRSVIGVRSVESYANLRKAGKFLESSMGRRNMGYGIEKQEFSLHGKECWNVIAENPGERRAKEIVLIAARYNADSGANPDGAGPAVVMALAGAMTGGKTDRSVRFVAFADTDLPTDEKEREGSQRYARRLRFANEDVVAALVLEQSGTGIEETRLRVSESLASAGAKFSAAIGAAAASEGFAAESSAAALSSEGVPALEIVLPGGSGEADSAYLASITRVAEELAVLVKDLADSEGR